MSVQAGEMLQLTTEDLPPYNIPTADGRNIAGIVGEKVMEIMRRANIEYTLEIATWQRAYNLALTQPNTCVFATTRIEEREALFKWVGPMATTEWVVIGRNNSPPINQLEDLKEIPIAGYRSDASAIYLTSHQYNVVTATSPDVCLRNLVLGRIDYWVAGRLSSSQIIRRQNAEDKVKVLLAFNRRYLYLACNPAVPNQLIETMQNVWKSMEADGTLRQIDQRYMQQP
ncbi:transporter substrate-binding domain-containing protein [Chitinivorax sp. B]|uniref:substrate-binding periplasmic protein n=1 Tax=Chitinivorax sp. B TaxID=2502235 RepID=UPI001484D90A|nr:transporter substrate-binding domain-containing protein [Chitinivorax sp. B]